MDTVCVIGVGFVGESLVKVFSKKHRVIGYDTLPSRVDDLKTLFHNNSNVTIQNTTEGLEASDLFCISVPTLLRKDETTGQNYVDGSYIQAALETIKIKAKRGSTVVIESSVSVGMTRKLLHNLAKERGLFVGFSPERIDPGRIDPPAEKIPKVVSGMDEESLSNVCRFYDRAFENIVKVSTLETAEMCKLYENCFRMVNIAYANEGADACKRFGIDPFEMIRACETKPYGFMPFYPGLGVGGHCICINPYYLSAGIQDSHFSLLMKATHDMEDRPIQKAIQVVTQNPNVKSYLVVGIAFKPGQSYCGNSPSLAFANQLREMGMNVYILDPLVTKSEHTLLTQEEALEKLESGEIEKVVIGMKQWNVDFERLKKYQYISFVE